MIVVDAHQDIAYNRLAHARDYLKSAWEKRRIEPPEAQRQSGVAMLGLPDALLGRVALVFSTLFVAPRHANPQPWDDLTYTTPREAYDLALLSQNMLKGADLTSFIKRSVELASQ